MSNRTANIYFFTWMAVVIALGFYARPTVQAQSAQAATFVGLAAHTTCLAPTAGAYYLCQATDGTWISNNGSPYFQVVAPTAVTGAVLSIQGVVPGATGSIKLTCTGTFPPTTTTPTTSNSSVSFGLPTVTVPVTCSAVGS